MLIWAIILFQNTNRTKFWI